MLIANVALLVDPLPSPSLLRRVHSVFAHGFNIQTENGALIWCSSPSETLHPRSIIVDALDTSAINAEETVFARKTDSDIVIAIGNALELRIKRDTPHASSAVEHRTLSIDATAWADEMSLALRVQTLRRPAQEGHEDILAFISQHLKSCIAASLRNDKITARSEAALLVGRGFGLTPSGDDALTGALAFLACYRPDAFSILAAAVRPLADRTTDVSRAYLELACDGYASEAIRKTLSGFSGGPDRHSLDTLLSMGHTSGQDSVLGIIVAAHATLDTEP